MKIIKMNRPQRSRSKINRQLIEHIGNSLYLQDEVKEVIIVLHFNDGTSLSYKRDEDEDDFENCDNCGD